MMQFLTAPPVAGELIRLFLMASIPLACGLIFCVKSPLARGGKIRCSSCRERISVSASVCPYCRRKVRVPFSAFRTRFAQFLIGWFLGGVLEMLLIYGIFRLLLVFF